MKKQVKERNLEEVLSEMTELVHMQEKALRSADNLLRLKDCVIKILEEQKRMNDKDNKVLRICFYSLVAINLLFSILQFILWDVESVKVH